VQSKSENEAGLEVERKHGRQAMVLSGIKGGQTVYGDLRADDGSREGVKVDTV
jgi:hypothetical protein